MKRQLPMIWEDRNQLNTVAQSGLLLGIEDSDKTSSKGHPSTVYMSPDNGPFSPSTGTEAELPSSQSTTRSCGPGDFLCADGTCISQELRCDHFYDCKDFSDEQYCLG